MGAGGAGKSACQLQKWVTFVCQGSYLPKNVGLYLQNWRSRIGMTSSIKLLRQRIFSRPMPFCAKGVKRHWIRVRNRRDFKNSVLYCRLKIHVGSKIDLKMGAHESLSDFCFPSCQSFHDTINTPYRAQVSKRLWSFIKLYATACCMKLRGVISLVGVQHLHNKLSH